MTDSSDEVPPPWIRFPRSETWAGGRQGIGEAWLIDEFLPFWRRLTSEEREDYLARWPPPHEEWHGQMTEIWK